VRKRIPTLVLAAAMLALGFLAATWLRGQGGPGGGPATGAPPREPGVIKLAPGAPQLAAIKVAAVEEAPLPLAEPLNARIAYDENVTARVSSPIPGRVVRLVAAQGDVVKSGDPLVVVDSPELAAAVADLEKAVSDETRKKAAFERSGKLFESDVVARKELENARAEYDQARAEARRAELRLRNLGPAPGARGAEYALRAPIAGVVADRHVNPGMQVRPDLPEPLFTITDPTRLWVIVDLPERALGKVQPGRPVAIEVDAFPGERFTATVARIGEVVDPTTRRIPVRATLPNPQRRMKPEMYARATLLAGEGERAVRVPNEALVTEGLYTFAFVERAPGEFERRRLSFAFQTPESSYVLHGLVAGERVVTGGALLLNAELAENRQ
jgi:cobalt-zinc-cadmium efflux system membrane fusion protein